MFKFKGLGYTPRTVTFGMKILVKEWCVCVCVLSTCQVNVTKSIDDGWVDVAWASDWIISSNQAKSMESMPLNREVLPQTSDPRPTRTNEDVMIFLKVDMDKKKHDLGMEHIYNL